MNELELLTIGTLIGLISSIIIQVVTHKLSSRRDKNNWLRDEIRREREKLETKKSEFETKKSELKSKHVKLQKINVDYLTYIIILLNQRRDALLGFDQNEQHERADVMREILSKLNKDELEAIVEEKKPLPELPGKPKSLSS